MAEERFSEYQPSTDGRAKPVGKLQSLIEQKCDAVHLIMAVKRLAKKLVGKLMW
ncbi:MAG: hypothetical protein MJK13_00695 [Pseudomonadales bacterium]|nr:hypothetical protein [Pseudomonadales bacterium]